MLRAAVVGVGYLGSYHAKKYHAIENIQLVAVVDKDMNRAKSIASQYNCTAYSDHSQLPEDIDIVSIVADTSMHYTIAKDLLHAGKHLLIEKPMCTTSDQAQQLIKIAQAQNRHIQIGHIERFNSVYIELKKRVVQPLFIEFIRIAPFTNRSSRVDVVLDVMIHDIDLSIDLVNQPPEQVVSVGGSVMTEGVDVSNSRIQFLGGCVANVTASRISEKTVRQCRVFQKGCYMVADMHNKHLRVIHVQENNEKKEEIIAFGDEVVDALERQIRAFISSVENNTTPIVSGADGHKALVLTERINNDIRQSLHKLK